MIGRQFEPLLLAGAVGEMEIHDRLAAMQALDLIHLEEKSGDYAFKHALVRDALYQSLLNEARTVLHAKIASEIERRSGNRITEVAEVLAYHQSNNLIKPSPIFQSDKNLSVYSLDEAAAHLNAALAILDQNPDCASDDRVADFLETYGRLFNVTRKLWDVITILQRHFARINRLADDQSRSNSTPLCIRASVQRALSRCGCRAA